MLNWMKRVSDLFNRNILYDFILWLLQRETIMFGKGGLGNLMKQAQQMQEKMQQMQEEIANLKWQVNLRWLS